MTTVGNRNRRIIIERGTAVGDDYTSEGSTTWAQHTEAFAEVLFGTGQERREAAQEGATAPATFIVPWTPKTALIAPKDRISAVGGYWDITSAIPVGFNKEIHITAVRQI